MCCTDQRSLEVCEADDVAGRTDGLRAVFQVHLEFIVVVVVDVWRTRVLRKAKIEQANEVWGRYMQSLSSLQGPASEPRASILWADK